MTFISSIDRKRWNIALFPCLPYAHYELPVDANSLIFCTCRAVTHPKKQTTTKGTKKGAKCQAPHRIWRDFLNFNCNMQCFISISPTGSRQPLPTNARKPAPSVRPNVHLKPWCVTIWQLGLDASPIMELQTVMMWPKMGEKKNDASWGTSGMWRRNLLVIPDVCGSPKWHLWTQNVHGDHYCLPNRNRSIEAQNGAIDIATLRFWGWVLMQRVTA